MLPALNIEPCGAEQIERDLEFMKSSAGATLTLTFVGAREGRRRRQRANDTTTTRGRRPAVISVYDVGRRAEHS